MVESECEPSSQDEESEDQSEEEKQPRRKNNNQRWNQEPRGDSKVEILEFYRKTQGDELLKWILTVKRVFDLKEYAEEKNIKLVVVMLKGYAFLWWENLKRDRERM